MKEYEVELEGLASFTPAESNLLTQFADILPNMFVINSLPVDSKQRLEVESRHHEIVEKCLDAGLARTIGDIRNRFIQEMNKDT